MAAAFVILFAACSKNTPKGVVKTYYSEVQNQQYDKAVLCFANLNGDGDEEVSMQDFAGKLESSMKSVDGLKSYEVLGDSICNDSLAYVQVKCVFGNGEEEDSKVKVVKQDNEWKIDPLSK
ncbi:MAG: DUF4878 domain-containing protein [Bacteroidales bacterium]|nr:DUF4878 domain-containing protein [Bacteroidales bacterium]